MQVKKLAREHQNLVELNDQIDRLQKFILEFQTEDATELRELLEYQMGRLKVRQVRAMNRVMLASLSAKERKERLANPFADLPTTEDHPVLGLPSDMFDDLPITLDHPYER